jgi:hypothetical protein
VIARKNITRLSDLGSLAGRGIREELRNYADPQLFIIETGKTALTTLTNVASRQSALRLVSGEQMDLHYGDKTVSVVDGEGFTIGQLEPLLAQRLKVTQQPEYAPIRFAGHESGDFVLTPSQAARSR